MSDQDANPTKRQRTEEIVGPPVLPAEMFELVIDQMNVNEWLACRVVCKFFKQMVDRIKLRSLVIAESEDSACESVFEYRYDDYDYAEHVNYQRFSDRFFFVSNDPVYESDALIAPSTTAGLRTLVNHFDLSQLRRLFVVEVRNGRAHFDLLNRLIQLEHLQINWIEMDCNLRLQLPNLRTLSIVQLNRRDNYKVSLVTPNLKNFETHSLRGSNFRFEHPDSVVFLQVSQCAQEDVFELRTNLEVLVCEWADDLAYIDYNKCSLDDRAEVLNFSAFPKLRRVDCARMTCAEGEELCHQLNSQEIDFYYCGMKIDDLHEDLGCLLNGKERDLVKLLDQEWLLDNYDWLADSLYFCDSIKYRHLEVFCSDKIPENFANKFYLVRSIIVPNEIERVELFVQLVRCFKNLKSLSFDSSDLPPELFERHSHLFARLHELSYRHFRASSLKEDKINFKFILNLRYLEKFDTNKPISMRLVSEAFSTLKHLKTIIARDFKITRKENEFEMLGRKSFSCSSHKFGSIPEMLKFVEEKYPALCADID